MFWLSFIQLKILTRAASKPTHKHVRGLSGAKGAAAELASHVHYSTKSCAFLTSTKNQVQITHTLGADEARLEEPPRPSR